MGESRVMSHRKTNATAPVLDSTRMFAFWKVECNGDAYASLLRKSSAREALNRGKRDLSSVLPSMEVL